MRLRRWRRSCGSSAATENVKREAEAPPRGRDEGIQQEGTTFATTEKH
jgi:hypothetical protein